MPARFGFTVVLPPFAGSGQDESVVATYVERLQSLGGVRFSAEEYGDRTPLVLLVATGGTEGATLGLHERRERGVPGEPVLLLAHPGNNSLPAAMEVLARLQQDGVRGRIAYVRGLDDEAGWRSFARALDDAEVRARLQAARIGMVGDPSDWLVASSPDPDVVTRTWGPEIVRIAMEELGAAIDGADRADYLPAAALLAADATDIGDVDDAQLPQVAKVWAGLRAVVAGHDLDAVTVRCFDIVVQRATSGCFALSALIDAGVVAGCEGDIVSTVGMLWAKLLTGETPWMANPADIDVATDSLWLAHCTVPRTIVDSYALDTHFESGLGIGIAGELPTGPVTLLRIGGAEMDDLWLAEGELTEVGHQRNLCRTQARVVLPGGDVESLLTAPLGNHIVMVRGHHADRLAEWWATML